MSTPAKIQLEKRRFIHRMGPYHRQATAEGDKSQERFLEAVFRQYRERWPIDTRDYPDIEFMKKAEEAQRVVN